MAVPKFSRRKFDIVSATSTASGAFSLGQKYGKIHAFHVQSYADSTKAATGVDTSLDFEIKDANGVVVFKGTSQNIVAGVAYLPNIPGITGPTSAPIAVDSKGATGVTAAALTSAWVCASPCRVTLGNAGTATDYLEFLFYVEV